MDPQNEWIVIAGKLPWRAWETLYAAMFPAETGNVAKPCRMMMGSLIIQQHMGFTDRDLVDQLRQNPYYQYFIGLEAFQHDAPFARTLLVTWRKRLALEFIIKARSVLPTMVILVLMTTSKRIDSIGHFTGLLMGLICRGVLINIFWF